MSLLDDALRAVTVLPLADAPATDKTTVAASIDLTGVHATVDRPIAKFWSVHGWADASWSGNRSAGLSLKGSF
jgi:hypothetical protein